MRINHPTCGLQLIRALERGHFIVLLDNVADSRSVLPLLPRGDASKSLFTDA
jgi:hypothetical protein